MIDDDVLLLKLYAMNASIYPDIELLQATNTDDGRRLARAEFPDVILLDLILHNDKSMPMSELDKNRGYNFLVILKGDPDIGHIPVIVFSNIYNEHDEDRARQLQASDYLIKSQTTPQEVFRISKEACELSRAVQKMNKTEDAISIKR